MENLKNDVFLPNDTPNRAGHIARWLNIGAIVIFGGAFLWHWFLIWTWAVDIPFMDDWNHFPPQQQPILSWLFALHNEHRVATTRLLILALWRLDGWDLVVHQVLNFAIYGVVLLSLLVFARRRAIEMPLWAALGFLLFPLSPIAYENHIWATQTQWHFVLLFLFWAVLFLWDETQSTTRVMWGTLCCVLSIYSLSAGLVASVVIWLCFTLFKRKRWGNASHRKLELRQWMATGAILLVASALYLNGYHKPEAHPAFSFPWTSAFWEYFLALLASGFGLLAPSGIAARGFFALVLCLSPLLGEWVQNRRRHEATPPALQAIFCAQLAILAMLAAIAGGRAGLGIEQAYAPRYTEFVLMLCPLTAFAWWGVLRARPRWRLYIVAPLWLFFALCQTRPGNWNQFARYEESYRVRNAQITAMHERYVKGENCNCRGLAAGRAITIEEMRAAKALGLSFMRLVEKGNRQ